VQRRLNILEAVPEKGAAFFVETPLPLRGISPEGEIILYHLYITL
jgi:hypothetical protein